MAAIAIGVDLGTTTITALAWDSESDSMVALFSVASNAEVTSATDKAVGRSEWDPDGLARLGFKCIKEVTKQLGARRCGIAGIGITCQQHGVVILDPGSRPLTPLVNWQDRRGDDPMPATPHSYAAEAGRLVGEAGASRAGCRLATGYMGVTLFWLQRRGLLPSRGTVCFIGDYLGSRLTGLPPVCDPTNAAGSGLLDAARRSWDRESLAALGLPEWLFPEIRAADEAIGPLSADMAKATGLSAGTPVFVALGDCQAAYVGSGAAQSSSAFVNIGTGAQVAAPIPEFRYASPLETRPLPGEGYLLVSAQPCGGRAYAILERFFRQVLRDFASADCGTDLIEQMNRLAESVPPGADGLMCEPLFTGTRVDPSLRATWSGMSADDFTAAHMSRALIEGIARCLHEDYQTVCAAAGRDYGRLVGGGNALRRNTVLRDSITREFGVPLTLAPYGEEAALGAARMAARGAAR